MAAQSPNTPAKNGSATLLLPVPGVPISFEQVEELSNRDGSNKGSMASKVVRDTAGRIRIEGPTITTIIDPVASLTTVLVPEKKTAIRVPLQKGEGQATFVSFGLVDGPADSPISASTAEQLGKRSLEGVEFEGTRIVYTAEPGPQIIETQEEWFSEDLKLKGLIVESGRSKIYKAHIQNLRREEPDPALFSMLSDYSFIDVARDPVTGAPHLEYPGDHK